MGVLDLDLATIASSVTTFTLRLRLHYKAAPVAGVICEYHRARRQMPLFLQQINYSDLNSRQRENYNFQKLSAVLADFGFATLRLSDD